MKLSFRPKLFLIWLVVCIVAGFLFSTLFHVSFWWGIALAAGGMFINSLLAEWEDRRPGGFLNPTTEDSKDHGPSAS